MNRTPLLATLQSAARTARSHTGDMLLPLAILGRGGRKIASGGTSRFKALPRERRGQVAVGIGAALVILWFVPFGILAACAALFVAAGVLGWERRHHVAGAAVPAAPDATADSPAGPHSNRLDSLHRALVPHFAHPDDPTPLYTPAGSHADAFDAWEFDADGRLARLELRYPDLFTDGEPEDRARIERAIRGKAGTDRDYRFDWDPANARLHVTALAPLPSDIAAQRFVVPPGEIVLGFTDTCSTERTIPVSRGGETLPAPPLTWRTGPRSAEPHLLVLGSAGSGRSTLLRSVVLQALHQGDAVIVDGAGTGDFACLAGRTGVQAVESTPEGAHAVLEWAEKEAGRRLDAVNRAKRAGQAPPPDARRPLWIILDQPVELAAAALASGHQDPQIHLDALLRQGRAANITVAVADDLTSWASLSPALRQHCRARVVLGPIGPEDAQQVLGSDAPATGAAFPLRGGRGWARVGDRPCARLQVPATPDPLEHDVPDDERTAVLGLLPPLADPGAAEDETPPQGIAVRLEKGVGDAGAPAGR